jgi:uncharacterized protein
VVRDERRRPRPADDPHAEFLRRRGDEHEARQLALLSAQCGGHVDLTSEFRPWIRTELEAAARATEAAMRSGAPLIFQATLFDGRWQGRVDFLRLRHDGTYEILDTKLARSVRPRMVHQLSLYGRLLGDSHPLAHVILGDGRLETIDLRRYSALHRAAVMRLEAAVESATPATEPEPIPHCDICELSVECRGWLRERDHLSFVAGMRRDQREKVNAAGIATLGELAVAPPDLRVHRLGDERLTLLRSQARLQVDSRDRNVPTHRHLEPARARGYARLPAPDPGDVFFDLEGDPYVGIDGGLEYLWGWCDAAGSYACAWAHDARSEHRAFEQFVDMVRAWRERFPRMHVYHYGAHEASTLRGLALRYATREDEVDDLLRQGVLVDLYAVVRQGLQVGEESYSLKKLERHHRFVRRETSIRGGGGSIVAYERWLQEHDDTILEAIRAYNQDDCSSTLSLRNWLHQTMAPEAAAAFGVDFTELAEPETEETPAPPAWLAAIGPIVDDLTRGLPTEPEDDDRDQAERRLLAQLLRYHQREGKPQWWRHFELAGKTSVELEDELDALGSLRPDPSLPPTPFARSLDYAFTFPPQEFRLSLGDVIDPATDSSHKLIRVTDTHVFLRRGATSEPPAPTALIPSRPIDPRVLRERISEVARSVLGGDGRFAALRSVLRREPPTVRGVGESVEALTAATLALDRSHLAIQGPPGTGKTYRAARMIVAALRAGRRVAITAPSHAAIQNLLAAIEAFADETGYALGGVYKGEDYESAFGMIESVTSNADADGDFELVAGTPWLLAREEHCDHFDFLFVDEAGQFALANLVAAGACARSLVLLGDPQQLPQVTQAAHPGDSGNSVLEHLLAGRDTIDPERGVLLTESWRMHPEICAFVSERSYDGLLHSRDECALRWIEAFGELSGAGLRVLEVSHGGCAQASDAEARAIAAACRELLAGTVSDDVETRPVKPADIMVVAPYNLAVRTILKHVPDGVQVGTVDKFQGREAPIVFFAMTCSSGHDVPRGLEFLFSRNRLNVAISRARCLAVLVHCPTLLQAECRDLSSMELVNGVCRLAELATPVEAFA